MRAGDPPNRVIGDVFHVAAALWSGMDTTSLIGWGAAVILLLTLGRQVWKEWDEGTTRGLSKWLFVGQIAASLGFVVYSWLKKDWVFVVTNFLILATAIAGQVIFHLNRRRAARRKQG